MKKLMIAGAVFCIAFASCNQGSKDPKTFSAHDSLSYAAGIQFATNIYMQDSTLNSALIAAAYKDVFAGKGVGKMTLNDAIAFIENWFMVREPARANVENQAWFDEVKAANPNVKTTDRGLMYEIINPGDPALKVTSEADVVSLDFRGSLRDGTVFDARNNLSYRLDAAIPGWFEGLKLIGKGGEITLWVPSELGYGNQPAGPIPANSALKYEIKLLDVRIDPANNPENK